MRGERKGQSDACLRTAEIAIQSFFCGVGKASDNLMVELDELDILELASVIESQKGSFSRYDRAVIWLMIARKLSLRYPFVALNIYLWVVFSLLGD